MILQAVFDLVSTLLQLVFGWINLPDLPDAVMSVIDELFSCLQGGRWHHGGIYRYVHGKDTSACPADCRQL